MGRSNIFIEFYQLSGMQLIVREVKDYAGMHNEDLEIYTACGSVVVIDRNNIIRGGVVPDVWMIAEEEELDGQPDWEKRKRQCSLSRCSKILVNNATFRWVHEEDFE